MGKQGQFTDCIGWWSFEYYGRVCRLARQNNLVIRYKGGFLFVCGCLGKDGMFPPDLVK